MVSRFGQTPVKMLLWKYIVRYDWNLNQQTLNKDMILHNVGVLYPIKFEWLMKTTDISLGKRNSVSR